MFAESYLRSAQSILQEYSGPIPFTAWIKDYFRQFKKYGSKDRKAIMHLCYCYFRLGGSFSHSDIINSLLIAQFLCSYKTNYFLESIKPSWNEKVHLSLNEKFAFLGAENELENIFPFPEELSDLIERYPFYQSFLIQPDLFLRVRPGYRETVTRKLQQANIPFEACEADCLRLSNSSRVDEVLQADKEYVVQDKSSQKVLDLLLPLLPEAEFSIWDCCAASGGKSILAYDKLNIKELTVSDIRKSILINLEARFNRAGIVNYRSFIMDLGVKQASTLGKFGIIICDAPCSGSGTWGRTPEQLRLFTKDKIDFYAALQKKIAANAAMNTKEGGYFLYITCSVFKKENEDVVDHLTSQTALKFIDMRYIKGYDEKADTLFVALFQL